MQRLLRTACVTASLLAASAAPAKLGSPVPFTGEWRITEARIAPWAKSPIQPADEAVAKSFVGQAVRIGNAKLEAPAPLGCSKPRYTFRDAGADTMFEGGLNADGQDRPTDPVALATELGMTSPQVRAMTASCSEVEFFLIDPDTILFGLDNRVFRMVRQKRP